MMKLTLKSQSGFSLIELMIAMVLGLLLSAGIFTVFSGSKRSTDLNTTMADMQENARFALNQLSTDIQMAGFQGCKDANQASTFILALDAPNTLPNGTLATDLKRTAITGSVVTGNTWTPQPPMGNANIPSVNRALVGSDALTLQFGSEATFPLAINVGGSSPKRNAPIMVDTTPGISSEPFNIKAGEFAIISNCTGADLIKVSSANAAGQVTHTNGDNSSNRLSFDYRADTRTKFMRFNSNVYYVGDTGTTSPDGIAVPGLFQQKLPYTQANPPLLMVSGVENMRIMFGMRDDNGLVSYMRPNDSALRTDQIESIRIGLLMVSETQVADQADQNTYFLAGLPIAAGNGSNANTHARDRRFRQAFSTTVKIRNRRIN